MSKRKICVVITARPSYARVKMALEAIKNHPSLDLQIIVTASAIIGRYGNVSRVIESDGFEVIAKAMTLLDGENPISMAKTTGLGVIELSTLFSIYQPDAVVTIADRYETIATAISAAYLNIPLIHIQGGEITGNIDEKVRHSITKLADLHLVSNSAARNRVIQMGENESSVINTGCPSIDLAAQSLSQPILTLSEAVSCYGGVGANMNDEEGYIIVLQHPVTNEFSQSFDQIQETIKAVHMSDLQVVWLWPNPDAGSDGTSKGIRMFREETKNNKIHFFKNLEPEKFLRLLRGAKCIVGNSSVAIRECAFLGIPAVNIGTRQEGRDRGRNVLDVSYEYDQILEAIKIQSEKYQSLPQDHIYGDGSAGLKIAEACANMPLVSHKKLAYKS